ncbi:GNAT family N-acetyltransferase [Pseudoalteromonas denitrificans]|uniref:tRNA(Met) cytidine acetyltransferase TmcA n=1 Tax=Pseudoalteromonas denitrificans DSM 6059 TaxID=1123010 RepID=A0A1I1SFM9_9GAMM|nr:GNAT family N-acetyltransferase [Pseudoalteromonas denitrificans]SFD45294.1 tRNA(Met) cytidine acetyltransferase [Pseudoalteromonas denitrificans DSM 6059]
MSFDNSLPVNLIEYLKSIKNNRHRQLLLLTGSPQWTSLQANIIIEQLAGKKCILSKNKNIKHAYWPEHNHQVLGQEYQVALYDGYSGLIPDKLAAITGTITYGGILIFIQPDLKTLNNFIDTAFETFQSAQIKSNDVSFFNQRLSHLLSQQDCIYLDQTDGWKTPKINEGITVEQNYSQQESVVTAIIKTAQGRANRPLLITADRGRGKSSALGLAAAALFKENKKILISASQRRSVESAFKHLASITEQEYKAGENTLANLRFVAPDKLLNEHHNADVIFIDEAAALPVTILKKVLKNYPRVVFASTVYGYEGTGRGFTLRFIPFLKEHYKNWQRVSLQDPIRFAKGDPLEKCINQLLCLEADCAVHLPNKIENHHIIELSQKELSTNENLLNQVFGLLVLAHYQTTVNDLRQLLDGNQLKIFITLSDSKVIAAALIALEGQISNQLSEQILQEKRRPKGHLLAQSVSQLANSNYFLINSVARVIRIAVHPELTRHNYGKELLQYIESNLSSQVSAIGASFGGYASLLNFWQNSEYHIIKLGFKKDKVSGEHSCIVMKPLINEAIPFIKKLKLQFEQQLPLYLLHSFSHVNPKLIRQIVLKVNLNAEQDIEKDHDKSEVRRFLSGLLSLEQIIPNLWRLIWLYPNMLSQCNYFSQELIIRLILQNQQSEYVQIAMSIKGKKQIIKELHSSITELLSFIK